MSINDDEWYYGEDNQRWVPKGDASRYMRGDGLEEEHDPFKKTEDFDISLVGQSIEPCQCDLGKFTKAVNELVQKLKERPEIFPAYENQFDSFAQVGGYAGGVWHKYVDIAASRIETRDERGYIRLGSNCAVPGHSCNIIKIGEDEFILDGLTDAPAIGMTVHATRVPAVEETEFTREYGRDEEPNYQAVHDDEESEEEARMYDERTFGDLDESEPKFDIELLPQSPEMWRSSAYSDEKVVTYISALLEPRDIAYLSRFMPIDEVSAWIEEFGEDSLEALHMLNVALGGLHHEDDLNPDNFDTAVTRLTKDIRTAAKKHFVKYKNAVAAQEQKNRLNRENHRG
jgi:hypothetical protein